jgi:hypothetical protein
MKKSISIFAAILFASIYLSSCTTINKSMREANVRVELNKNDFTLSDQFSAEAKSTKILGIDFARLFLKKTGNSSGGSGALNLASIPVIGTVVVDRTSNYALYDIMTNNPGYDVVFYPQYETKVVRPLILGFLYSTTTVKATARLGKLK